MGPCASFPESHRDDDRGVLDLATPSLTLNSCYTTPRIPHPLRWQLAGRLFVSSLPFAPSVQICPMGRVMISRQLSTLLGTRGLAQARLARLTRFHRDTPHRPYYDPTFTSPFGIALHFGGGIGRSKVHSSEG